MTRVSSADSTVHNGALLFRHILEKGWQLGSVAGTIIIVPIARLRASKRNQSVSSSLASTPNALRLVGLSALVGTAAAGLLGTVKVYSIPKDELADGMQDRAYRLHFNGGQKRVDTLSRIGMVMGGGLSLLLVTGSSPAAAAILGGAATGSACGVFTHVLLQQASG